MKSQERKPQERLDHNSKAKATRERILNVAAQCFVEHGYRDTRMTAIAARCGISRAALYKYFPSKDAILLALNGRVVEDAKVAAQSIGSSREPATVVIAEWMREHLLSEQADFVRAVIVEDAQGVLLLDEDVTGEALVKVKRALVKVIRRGIKEGDISPDINASDTAHVLQTVATSIKRNNLSSRPIVELRKESHIDMMIGLLIAGLREGL